MTSFIKGLIVDDELSGRENLKILIESYCTEIKVVGTASSAAEAKCMIGHLSPDVVFLDVNMPVLDGFDFLESGDSSILSVYNNTVIIYNTNINSCGISFKKGYTRVYPFSRR